MVGQVENIEAVLQHKALRNLRVLPDGNVRALLPGLAENISLSSAGQEIRFERIPRRDGGARKRFIDLLRIGRAAWEEQRHGEAGGLQCREIEIVANGASHRVLRRATGSKRSNGIGNSIRDAVESAAYGAG